ncbi:S8 family serine peptidase, partial [Salmonella sp. s51228]|uniref:S8 family serine peptidase n=1 Tax=Salmonella sp. s51228 TaxID=3159652 RepID=UPI0039816DA9
MEAVRLAINRLTEAGIVVVTASGNLRRDACEFSPGSSGPNINVGAHDYSSTDGGKTCVRHVYWYSTLPSSPGMNYGYCVDVMAPGEYIWGANSYTNTEYVRRTGTSQATPHVAGV